jgi:hypothetical protein
VLNRARPSRRRAIAAFFGFASSVSAVLVASDVAVRGIDFPSVECIIDEVRAPVLASRAEVEFSTRGL